MSYVKKAWQDGAADALEKYTSLLSDGEKLAFIAKMVRTLATPIEQLPGLSRLGKTPSVLIKSRSPAELQGLEDAVRGWQDKNVHGNIYKGLKKMKVDKLYQKMEPFTGSTSEPHIRAQYGDRKIWALAHAPVQHAAAGLTQMTAGQLPIIGKPAQMGLVSVYNTGRVALEKALGVPGPLAYGATSRAVLPSAPRPIAPPAAARTVAAPTNTAIPQFLR